MNLYSRSRAPIKYTFGVLFFFIVGTALLISQYLSSQRNIISPLADETSGSVASTVLSKTHKEIDAGTLVTQIKRITNQQAGVYSVYVYSFKQDVGLGFNENTIFTAASVNKLPILAALYFEAQNGKIDLDKRITIQESDIQDYGTGSIRYEGPGGVYSIKTLAQYMIQKSDNTAAYVLTNIVGTKRIQKLVDSWGLTQTNIVNNKTSNKDMSHLLVKIYREQIANKSWTLEMLGYLTDSEYESRLPAFIPKDVKIYHKIGTETGSIHDVGIVQLPENPYYIGVMSNDIINDASAELAIAQISKIVYDYMISLPKD